MEEVYFMDLGLREYGECWGLQQDLLQKVIERKQLRRRGAGEAELPPGPEHYLLFVEHPPVYTLGKSGSIDNLLLSEEACAERGISFFRINRGGDITYHGPGQIVGYPILNLDRFFTDIHRYVRTLEEAVIHTLAEYGISGIRLEGYTGVWLPPSGEMPMRKICAIGVHLSRWVTMHGFAFNVNTELDYFRHIVPCGIDDEDKEVTSMERELGHAPDMEEVKVKLSNNLARCFGFAYAKGRPRFLSASKSRPS